MVSTWKIGSLVGGGVLRASKRGLELVLVEDRTLRLLERDSHRFRVRIEGGVTIGVLDLHPLLSVVGSEAIENGALVACGALDGGGHLRADPRLDGHRRDDDPTLLVHVLLDVVAVVDLRLV